MMQATVMTASQACRSVCATQAKNPATVSRKMIAVTMAATRIAVPVASGWKPQTAA